MADNLSRYSVGGFGDYSFQDPSYKEWGQGATETANVIKRTRMFPRMAEYLLKGSAGAEQSAMQGFESMYRARAQGEAAAFGEQQDRLGGEVASQGYSPELVRRMLTGGQAASQARIGEARGESDQGFNMFLTELRKNTGVELANLTMEQMKMIQQGYLAKQAKRASKSAGMLGLGGSALGMVSDFTSNAWQSGGQTATGT